jgi:hypothetical protein
MAMQRDVMLAQASSLDLWSKEWRADAGSGVEGAAEIGWQLAKIAKLVRAVAGVEPTAEPAGEPELPGAAVGELKAG